jgi:AraC-like DNA-binding protein
MPDRAQFETRHAPLELIASHRHHAGYAALVIEGSYIETSVDGPIECSPGTLLLHPNYHAHGDRFGRRGARVVNLVLTTPLAGTTLRTLQAPNVAEARAVLTRGAHHFTDLLAASSPHAASPELPDWQAIFLLELQRSEGTLDSIARRAGVSAAHASRALARSHGMTPQLLRRELRWRQAHALLGGDRSLAEIAALAGFADQSHLTRTARAITGLTPMQLRLQIKSVQDPPMPAAA